MAAHAPLSRASVRWSTRSCAKEFACSAKARICVAPRRASTLVRAACAAAAVLSLGINQGFWPGSGAHLKMATTPALLAGFAHVGHNLPPQVARKPSRLRTSAYLHALPSLVSPPAEQPPAELRSTEALRAWEKLQGSRDEFDAEVESELRHLSEDRPLHGNEDLHAPHFEGTAEDRELHVSLRRRAAELHKEDSADAVAELLYLQVVRRFHDAEAPMVVRKVGAAPKFEPLDPKCLIVRTYSKAALERLQEHVIAIIGNWAHLDRNFLLRISQLQASQVYAVSALFGYQLRHVDIRYTLDKLAGSFEAVRAVLPDLVAEGASMGDAIDHAWPTAPTSERHRGVGGGAFDRYVSDFGFHEVKLSQEAKLALELQVASLFSDPANAGGSTIAGEQQHIDITVSGLRRLVLEAVAFGSFLGEAEEEAATLYELDHHATIR